MSRPGGPSDDEAVVKLLWQIENREMRTRFTQLGVDEFVDVVLPDGAVP
jgi:hypothetical protein